MVDRGDPAERGYRVVVNHRASAPQAGEVVATIAAAGGEAVATRGRHVPSWIINPPSAPHRNRFATPMSFGLIGRPTLRRLFKRRGAWSLLQRRPAPRT
jgi:hypothetical protein